MNYNKVKLQFRGLQLIYIKLQENEMLFFFYIGTRCPLYLLMLSKNWVLLLA